MTERRESYKLNLKKQSSHSASALNLFNDIQSYVSHPRTMLSQIFSYSTSNLKKDYFTIVVAKDSGDSEIKETHAVEDRPLREIVRARLSKHFAGKVTDFNLFVSNSNTPLPKNLSSCRFVAGLTVIAKDIQISDNNQIQSRIEPEANRALNRSHKGQDSLHFIEETEEECSNGPAISVSLDEMVPAASEVCHIAKKSSSISPKCRRLSTLHTRMTGNRDDRITDMDDRFPALVEKLDTIFNAKSEIDDNVLPSMGEDWQTLVGEERCKEFSEVEKSQQDAIWELICTEVSFLKRMRMLISVFVKPVKSVVSLDLSVGNIDVQRLFTNIEDVYQSNMTFWTLHLKPMYDQLSNCRDKLNPLDLKEAFREFSALFKSYLRYITDQNVCTEYFKELYKSNDTFRYIIDYCERKSSDRLSFLDLFIQPMQRLTKYKLLLQAILKRCSSNEESYEISKMVDTVEEFVKATNSALQCREQKNRIEDVMQKIAIHDSYLAPTELQNLIRERYRENCWVDLAEGLCDEHLQRRVIHQGLMKLKDYKEKLEVYCYLLTDMFLILRWKKNSTRLKLYRGPIKIDRIDVAPFSDDSRTCFTMITRGDFNFVDSGYLFVTNQSRVWLKYIEDAKRAFLSANNLGQTVNPDNTPKVLYSFQPSHTKIKRRCTTNSCKHCGIKSKEAEDRYSCEDTDLCRSLRDEDFKGFVIPEESQSTEHLASDEGEFCVPLRVCSIDNLHGSVMTKRYTGRLNHSRGGIILSFLQREDSIMSTGSKKSSSGVSSSNSSLLNVTEDVL